MAKKILSRPDELLAAAHAVKEGVSRSCLEDYRAVILALRAKGKSFAFIAAFLKKGGGPKVSPQSVHKFITKVGVTDSPAIPITPKATPRQNPTTTGDVSAATPAASQERRVPKLKILSEEEARAFREKLERESSAGS